MASFDILWICNYKMKWYLYKNSKLWKKECGPKMPGWKKMWNHWWRPRNGCDNSLMAKFLIMTIQVNLVLSPSETGRRTHKFTLLKFLPLNYYYSHFLDRHLWFHIFFNPGILGPNPFFTACCFCIDNYRQLRFDGFASRNLKVLVRTCVRSCKLQNASLHF